MDGEAGGDGERRVGRAVTSTRNAGKKRLSETVSAAFVQQIEWCRSLGSPFTARVLEITADDFVEGGVTASLVGDWPGDPVADGLPLRLAGALHVLVATSAAPELAAHYPPCLADGGERLRPAILSALAENQSVISTFLRFPPQTNEVGRSAVLVGGFHVVARKTGLPLRILEIGASAGLNLLWDRYRYALGDRLWGPERSAVVLAPEWRGRPLTLAADLDVVERAGCDQAPIDLNDPAACARLRGFVWADQIDRLDRLDAAITLAREAGVHVEQADAADWVSARLLELPHGCTTVLYHSIMWQYLSVAKQDHIRQEILAAGRRSTSTSPFAWLRFEPSSPAEKPNLVLTLWPGQHHFGLAVARPHGQAVEWLYDDEVD